MRAVSLGGGRASTAEAGGGARVLEKRAWCVHKRRLGHPRAGNVGVRPRGHAFTVSTQGFPSHCWRPALPAQRGQQRLGSPTQLERPKVVYGYWTAGSAGT